MNVLDAAHQILSEAGEPLHSKELTRRMLAQGLWQGSGKTPKATIEARLAMDIKRRGVQSRFRRAGPSIFALNDAVPVPGAATHPVPAQATSARTPGVTNVLSFTDAAEQVLGQSVQRKPMHYRTITDQALTLGLIETAGHTPEASMYAMILKEIERDIRRGEHPRFSKHGRGLVGLTRWQGNGLSYQIEQHNKAVRQKLHAQLHQMNPADFEVLAGRVLTKLGFEDVTVTRVSGDGGIDVRGTLVVGDVIRIRMAVQVKRFKQNVQSPVVQQVRGSLGAHDQGLIITTSDFSAGARTEAARLDATPVALMNGEQLVNLLVEHDIGVRRATHDLFELGEDDEEV